MQYTIEADEEFLRVKVWGRDVDTPPSDVCAAVLRESSKAGRLGILIELDQKLPLSGTSQYKLVSRLPEVGFTYRHRIALVHSTPAMQEANEFINLLAENRGLKVRNFREVDGAMAWLREETGRNA